jgi:hypothetical protein
MSVLFYQLVITVWIGAHPLTYTLPDLYPATDQDRCQARASDLFKHRKRKKRMTIECVETDKRAI